MITDIGSRAMLVTLSISRWTARRYDRRATATVENTYRTRDAGRFNKTLIAEEALADITRIAGEARTFHYTNTSPWSDNGDRLLSVANWTPYSAAIRQFHGLYDAASDVFAVHFDQYVQDSRHRLNGLFDAGDYPGDIRSRFSFSTAIVPIPNAADFRVSLSADETAAIRADIEATANSRLQLAHRDLYTRLADAVRHIADKLHDDKAIFRDSMVDNLRELCEIMPRLDVVGDPDLEALRRRAEASLLKYSPDTLRESGIARTYTARNADAILEAMRGMYDDATA